MKKIFACLALLAALSFSVGVVQAQKKASNVAGVSSFATSDFEALPSGPAPSIVLNSPPGTTAVLTGALTVEDSAANWPPFFGTKAVKATGPATLFLAGPVSGVSFAATNRAATDPNPTMVCNVVTGGSFLQTATLTFQINGQTSPVFGNFGIILSSGVYGFCTFNADLIDNLVIGS